MTANTRLPDKEKIIYVTIPCSAAPRETITKFYLQLMMFFLNCLTGLLSSSGLGRGSACREQDYLYTKYG